MVAEGFLQHPQVCSEMVTDHPDFHAFDNRSLRSE